MACGQELDSAGAAVMGAETAMARPIAHELKVEAAETQLKLRAAEIEPYVIEMRRHFHAHPELSGQEVETAKRISAELDALGVEYRCAAETGIIVTIRGGAPDAYGADGNPRRRIALRADMDALPVLEETDVPFASRNEGVMHACGHDCLRFPSSG